MNISDIKNHINNKSRLIGVDMGSKRVGLSICDENRKIASIKKDFFIKLFYKINIIQKIQLLLE